MVDLTLAFVAGMLAAGILIYAYFILVMWLSVD